MTADLFEPGRDPQKYVREAFQILEEAAEVYRPSRVYGLFSGGHDSLCSTHVAAAHRLFAGAVHINTGVGVAQTREFVRRTCRDQGWRLIELHPPPLRVPPGKRRPGIDYEGLPAYDALVLHYGFPGPAGHRLVYNRLKERCLRRLRRDTFGPRRRRGELMLLVGGMRLAESVRRMGNAEPHSAEPSEGRAWCAPILRWSDEDKWDYMAAAGLMANPVVGKLCISGECLCGAFARPTEMIDLERSFPDAARRIHELEARAAAAGVHAKWGTRPPRKAGAAGGQPDLFSLCWTCGQEGEQAAQS